jgi:phosphoenolpyruvate synthase/pyruvate phosphate dikinase
MQTLIKNFKEISKSDAQIAGGKGASLGEMTNAGISVPSGFVVLSRSFEQFLIETDLNVEIKAILKTVNNQKMHTVENASEKIQALILQAKMPEEIKKEIQKNFKKLDAKFVAVRSSATAEDGAEATWAGQLESYLNTTEKTLLENVQKCWASLFTPRAIFYRFEKKLHKQKISVAVVIQKMIQSEISGIAFSVHPVTEDYNQMIIEAGFALGEAIVSGSITPDTYGVSKNPRKIEDINISQQPKGLFKKADGGNVWKDISKQEGKKQKLSKKQILELSDLIIRIEDHYQFPVDIEWAYENKKFYIVQSRPITTLIRKVQKAEDGKGSIKKMQLFSTREHTLFYGYVWMYNNRHLFSDSGYPNVEDMIIVRQSNAKKLQVFYESRQVEKIFQKAKEYASELKYIEKIKKEYRKSFKFLNPYIVEGRDFKVVENFKEFYRSWLAWWTPMALFDALSNVDGLNEVIFNEVLKMRTESEKFADVFDAVFIKQFKKFYPQYSDLVYDILPEEVFVLAEKKLKQEEVEKIKNRNEGVALFNDKLISLENLMTELEKNKVEIKENIPYGEQKIIKGHSAYKGLVQGLVRIIHAKTDLFNVKGGEIIVTEMTSPDYISAIKKAAAIITDEGSITCHASIVARELKKPCIIGTKIATQVLHNGDLVEVDANNGIARILKRAKKSVAKRNNYKKI